MQLRSEHGSIKHRPYMSPSTLLVDSKIIALQLRSLAPYEWALKEIEGYMPQDPIPKYRQLCCDSYGRFEDPTSGQLRQEAIPLDAIDARDRDAVAFIQLRQPLMQLTHNAAAPLHFNWPACLVHRYSQELLPGLRCLRAWQVLPETYQHALWSGIRAELDAYRDLLTCLCTQPEAYCLREWHEQHEHWHKALSHTCQAHW